MGGSHHPFTGLSPSPPFARGTQRVDNPPPQLCESHGWDGSSPHHTHPTPHPTPPPRPPGGAPGGGETYLQ